MPKDHLPKFYLACTVCSWRCDAEFELRCPQCSSALDAVLDLAAARPSEGQHPELAYFDFLPVESREFLDDGISVRTPCRPAPSVGAAIGVPRLWVKDESRQPTGTTKDRLAAVVLAVFRQFGIKEWATSSTGNSATALARAVRRDQTMRAHFFCGRDFVAEHEHLVDDQITLTVVDGDYAAAGRAGQQHAARYGLTWEGGFFNWARREGLKLAYLEAFDEMNVQPDIVVQAISSGMGIMAAHKGAREYLQLGRLEAMPSFIMVQESTCAPMATAWRAGRTELTDADVVVDPAGLARAILLGDGRSSYGYMRDIATDSGGGIVSVSQRELVEARAMLRELEGLDVCYAAAATIAAVRAEAAAGRIAPDQVTLVNLTGRQRSDREEIR
ncbi:pyridoxal-phosphate dependent enzyme [Nocardia sp. NPDC051911]|uniref:threonine synthase n=1 Tax=Nocardia sp. NPDC051911 TaxID=3154648 RepID=UPI00343AB139